MASNKDQDAFTRRVTAALRRASWAAWKLSLETNTPFWVMKNGKIVNLNPGSRKKRRAR